MGFVHSKGVVFYAGKVEGAGARKNNPVPLAKSTKLKKAIDLYEDFTGHKAEYTDTYNMPVPDVGMKIGQCDGILYTTIRDGKTESYIHKFKKSSRPLLAVTFDGKQMIMVGGSYQFTERGIVDT